MADSIRALLSGKAVENAAVAFVIEYERGAGRAPRDTRGRGAPADVESDGRIIEVKAFGRSARTDGFLWLEERQYDEARRAPQHFYLYVVENVAQGDPAKFELRIVGGETLQRLLDAAKPQRTYIVPLRSAEYDGLAKETLPPQPHS